MNESVELRSVLADPSLAGVSVVAAAGASEFLAAAMALDFAAVTVNLAGCSERDEALERIGAALKFPSWFGRNWDALADCLADMSWWPAAGYLVLIEHPDAWREAEPESFDTLLEIIEEASQAWAEAQKPFWALLPEM
ncbi:barstar family protein [Luteimonas sp. 8-5]|uniref:barstar family protein n=1 Tax=Luteimonas sp. 8-5 TaxID=3039387 RepID=UPI002436D2FF|nr:barstar family protein [Luteimonas sp. 8-5]MDG6347341.1 barstar family protein [Luteimonas sp. 8-5]